MRVIRVSLSCDDEEPWNLEELELSTATGSLGGARL